MNFLKRGALLVYFILQGLTSEAFAHKPSDAYVNVEVSQKEAAIRVNLSVALKDLAAAVELDDDSDENITWGEVRAHFKDIDLYLLSRLDILADGSRCSLSTSHHSIAKHSDGHYLVLKIEPVCQSNASQLLIRYTIFFDVDRQHRGLLNASYEGEQTSGIFHIGKTELSLSSSANLYTQAKQYIIEGVWHIWIGFDHVLFLLSLLIPSVVERKKNGWVGVSNSKNAVLKVIGIVTAFTVAHSITLSLAVLGYIDVPSRLIESLIAISVGLAAANNLFRVFSEQKVWVFAFFFGLIHGFGFATVLLELGLAGSNLLLSLISFNAGVELGQIAIVFLFFPAAFLLRNSVWYHRWVLQAGSVAILLIASFWFAERAFL